MEKLSKQELKNQLQKLGVRIHGNYIRKKDLKMVLASAFEYKFFTPKVELYSDPTPGEHSMLIAVTYGERHEKGDSSITVPLKVYTYYSARNGLINGTSIDPNKSPNYDFNREKGWKKEDPKSLKGEEASYYKEALDSAQDTAKRMITRWK